MNYVNKKRKRSGCIIFPNKRQRIEEIFITCKNNNNNNFINLLNQSLNNNDDNNNNNNNNNKNDDDIDDDSDDFDDEDQTQPTDDESTYEYEYINKEVSTIDDLIELGKMYDSTKKRRYNFNLKTLNKLIEPLEKLNNLIGMDRIKDTLIGHIIYYLQDFQNKNDDMMHTVIQGPPGVGKTLLGHILGEIYYNMGIIKGNDGEQNNDEPDLFSLLGMKKLTDNTKKNTKKNEDKFIFKIVKRSDLIGKYLGHTAAKTQKVIDSCKGGVLFIDEAYALGNPEGRDSFSKECIDTLNQNLTENKANFLCIIAGYKDALDNCFFSYNEGLRRRFSFVYTIDPYKPAELRKIFIKLVRDIGWDIASEKDIPISFFEENYDNFKFFGGDMETLLFNCKIEHSKRVFGTIDDVKKKFTRKDIDNGFKIFMINRSNGNDKSKENDAWKRMYI